MVGYCRVCWQEWRDTPPRSSVCPRCRSADIRYADPLTRLRLMSLAEAADELAEELDDPPPPDGP
jgi:hypothetical protein